MMSFVTFEKKTSAVLRPLDARSSFDKLEAPMNPDKIAHTHAYTHIHTRIHEEH